MLSNKTFYTIFHANLAFSAIPTNQHSIVIEKTYFPLLEMVKKTKIKMGLEISGYSLEIVQQLHPTWITLLKQLIEMNLIELIGSGYMQIIGPLVPYAVNIKNQKLGIETYHTILGHKPKIAFVNEQTFSNSMVDLYYQAGYQAIIMEWNNAYSANKEWDQHFANRPVKVQGIKHQLPLLWSDSLLFQQFQRYVHSESTENEYFKFLNQYCKDKSTIPLYSSDLEIFNYRPGRFETEASIQFDEWKIIENLCILLQKKSSFLLPSEVLTTQLDPNIVLSLANFNNPIIVKKQDKYSLSRWSACGRGANKINTLCYRFLNEIQSQTDEITWKDLLKLWGSDYRTHITIDKWNHALDCLSTYDKPCTASIQTSETANHYCKYDNKYLYFTFSGLHMILNLKKGFTLDSIIYHGNSMPFGTIKHGELDYIEHGADYYTGTTVIESANTKKISDLIPITNHSCDQIGPMQFKFSASIDMKEEIKETKSWIIDLENKTITFDLKLEIPKFINGYIRCGTFTLKPTQSNKDFYLLTENGGNQKEKIDLTSNNINQHLPKSLLQSSKSGIGATEGTIEFYLDNKILTKLQIDRLISYPFIMLQNNHDNQGHLTRIHFSLQELDDTLKEHNIKEYALRYTIPLFQKDFS